MRVEWKFADLGSQSSGTVVRVHITGTGPNVRLLDSANYRQFAAGRWDRAKGYSFRPTRSPLDIPIPNAGHWFLVVDFTGLVGRAEFSYELLRAVV